MPQAALICCPVAPSFSPAKLFPGTTTACCGSPSSSAASVAAIIFERIGRVRRFNVFGGELESRGGDERPGYARRWKAVDEAIGGATIGAAIYDLGDGERICPFHYPHGVEEWLVVIAGTPTARTADGEQRCGLATSLLPRLTEGAHTILAGPGC